MSSVATSTLPIPAHFDESRVGDLWFVDYENLAPQAEDWAKQHGIKSAAIDKTKICVIPIDVQLTFAHPQGGLPVAGAYEDCVRACKFIYENLHLITSIAPTMDTHTVIQIFHQIFLIDDDGNHPTPGLPIEDADIQNGKWKVNPAVAHTIKGGNYMYLETYLRHYSKTLNTGSSAHRRYALTPWPYHAILGGLEHALIPLLHEAIFFHTVARHNERKTQTKGGNPLTENYSPIQPDVLADQDGTSIAQKKVGFLKLILDHDIIIGLGEAKSHCFAWFINDLLDEINQQDPSLVKKIYLLEDCTSPVVIPGQYPGDPPIYDATPQADEAFERFINAGMHVVKSTIPIVDWPGVDID